MCMLKGYTFIAMVSTKWGEAQGNNDNAVINDILQVSFKWPKCE